MGTTPEDIFSEPGQAVRATAKALTGKQLDMALKNRMGIVIDGTGKDYNKIKAQVQKTRELGYAVHMIFVNTDLDTALERNRMRPRVLPDKVVEKMWNDVQKNIGKFQALFRSRMTVVDNSAGSNIDRATLDAYKDIMNWSKRPPENSIAMKWIKKQRDKKKNG